MAETISTREITGYEGRDDWFQTWSGKTMLILDPDPDQICIEDIAHALARLCRYNGHVDCKHYSVAQHSVLVSRIVPEGLELEGLFHDAAEAYLGDCIRPLKNQLSAYRLIEDRWDDAIEKKFHLTGRPGTIKDADMVLLVTELRDLWKPGSRHERWNHKAESNAISLGVSIYPWDVQSTEEIFLKRYETFRRD